LITYQAQGLWAKAPSLLSISIFVFKHLKLNNFKFLYIDDFFMVIKKIITIALERFLYFAYNSPLLFTIGH